MTPTVQMNFASDENFKNNFWTCSGCSDVSNSSLGYRDTQSHILDCPGYLDIRIGLDFNCDADLVRYFRNVIRRRMNSC